MLKDQLRALCSDRGLPVSGTNDELTARLQGWDDAHAADGAEPDLLAEAGLGPDEPEMVEAPVDPTPPAPQSPTHEDPPEPDDGTRRHTVHRARFEVPRDGVIPTELHENFLRQTEQQAINGGYAVRGSACRVDYQTEGGVRYAVYEVMLGRRRQTVR